MAVNESDIEMLWRQFHRIWVGASEDACAAEEQLRAARRRFERGEGSPPGDAAVRAAAALRQRERHCRELLDQFERRQRDWRANARAFSLRYE